MTSHGLGIIILVSHELRNGDDERMRLNIEAERARKGYTKQQICRELNITGKTYNSYIQDYMREPLNKLDMSAAMTEAITAAAADVAKSVVR